MRRLRNAVAALVFCGPAAALGTGCMAETEQLEGGEGLEAAAIAAHGEERTGEARQAQWCQGYGNHHGWGWHYVYAYAYHPGYTSLYAPSCS